MSKDIDDMPPVSSIIIEEGQNIERGN